MNDIANNIMLIPRIFPNTLRKHAMLIHRQRGIAAEVAFVNLVRHVIIPRGLAVAHVAM